MTASQWTCILVVVSDPFRREQVAVGKAAAVASRCGAQLTLLNTFMLPQPTPEATLGSRKKIIEAARRERLQKLELLAQPIRRRGVEVKCAVEWDYPIHDAIVRQVLALRPDVVVADSHRHGRIARWLLTNTDWELIRSCPCPLWFARSARLPATPKVLVAVDPRHSHAKPARLDERLLVAADGLVQQLGGRISLIHAYQPGAVPGRKQTFIGTTQSLLEDLRKRHAMNITDQHVLPGDPSDVITRFAAQHGSDILVMGAVSRSLQGAVIGNTAEKVIDRVDCDLFVVKAAGFKTPVSRVRPKL